MSTKSDGIRDGPWPDLSILLTRSTLLWVKKISLGQVKKYLGQSRVGLLFTAGQKYAVWKSVSFPKQSLPLI